MARAQCSRKVCRGDTLRLAELASDIARFERRSSAGELRNGALVRVLGGWDIGSGDVHVVLPAGRAAKPSARAFADFIVSEFAHATFDGRRVGACDRVEALNRTRLGHASRRGPSESSQQCP